MKETSMPETNFRTLCEQLMELVEGKRYDGSAVIAKARTALAQPEPAELTDEDVRKILMSHGILYQHQGRLLTAGNPGLARSAKVSDIALVFRAVLACWGHPTPQPPADGEVAELVAWLRDRANSTSLAHTARRITRAADLLERLASDTAGLAAAADSLWADNVSLLDEHQ